MLTRAELRKGWCPGALAPMQARDGLIARLRISGARLPTETARAIAAAANRFGNSQCELTSRANLQLRGVTLERLPDLLAELDRLGLIDRDAAAESVRNVMISPLSGVCGRVDVTPIGAALEAALIEATGLHRLPGKFGFLIDDGGPLSLCDEITDVRFAFDEPREKFDIALGADAVGIGSCARDEIVATALKIARAFLDVGGAMPEPPRRMMDIISGGGLAALAAAAGRPATQQAWAPPRPAPAPPVGLLRFGDLFCFGAAAPFGRLSANMLAAAADAAQVHGRGEIRLTPWRALVLPGVAPKGADALAEYFHAAGFIVSPDDKRLGVAACGGAPACTRGTTATHTDALALAALARQLYPDGLALHVSGCAKGCARPREAPLTLVAHDGLYDLVLDGSPFDAASSRNLSLTAARDLLHAMAST
ncbi:precorrin-3B synthase [Methylocella silvestris BL2]|uniref:Precorrin-3B synthase n=1 Tax=Methylocella silvestris (strain DSM 15510 / CIP 108128 / LMG 27833 / NCIMB 13906 / BL2) TaxID=395965 RepID=B8EQG1_METSB|nr:precorrin-3B synthase [Methylocella silvestris]ACK52174.1 precorrin-3B synthase [Methylocella silvestris BL2]